MLLRIIPLFLVFILFLNCNLYSQSYQEYKDSVDYYGDKNEWEKSTYFAGLAIERAKIEKDTHYIDHAQMALNIVYFYDGQQNYRAAIDNSLNYFDILEKGHKGQPCEYAHYIGCLGQLYCKSMNYDSAFYYLKIADSMYNECDSLETVSYQFFSLAFADTYNNKNNIEKAKIYYDKAYNLLDLMYNYSYSQYFVSLNNIGEFYKTLNPKKAEISYNLMYQHRYLLDSVNIKLRENIYYNLGTFFSTINDINKFEQCSNMFLFLRQEYDTLVFEDAIYLLNFAYFYYNHGEDSLGLHYLEWADKLAKETFKSDKNNIRYLTKFYFSKAKLYSDIYDFNNARKYFNKLVEVSDKIYSKDSPSLANNYNSAAVFFHKQGDYSIAEKYYLNAIEIYKNLGNNYLFNLHRSYVSLGLLYTKSSIMDEAKDYLHKAVAYYKENPEYLEESSVALNNLGLFYRRNNNYPFAEKYYLESLELQKKLLKKGNYSYLDNVLNNLGAIALSQNQYKKAKDYYERAIKYLSEEKKHFNILATKKLNYSMYISNIAGVYAKEMNFAKADELFLESIDILEKSYNPYHNTLGQRYYDYAAFLDRQNKTEKTEDYYMKADKIFSFHMTNFFPLLNEKQKFAYIKYYNEFNGNLLSFLIKRSSLNSTNKELICDKILTMKSNIYSSSKQLKTILASSDDEALKALYKKWNKQKNQLAKYYKLSKTALLSQGIQLDSMTNSINALEKEIVLKSSASDEFNNQSHWKIIKNKLSKNEAFVEVFRLSETQISDEQINIYAAITIKSDSKYPEITLLDSEKEYEKLLAEHNTNINSMHKAPNINAKFDNSNLSDLYKKIWRPITKKLKNVSVVYVSLDGIFNKININTLYDADKERYLIEDIDIRIIASHKVIKKQNRESNNIKKTISFFGDPDFSLLSTTDSLLIAKNNENTTRSVNKIDSVTRSILSTPLPNTRIEIEEAAKLFSGMDWTCSKYIGGQALEDTLKKINSPGILHIATHGNFLNKKDIDYLQKSGIMAKHFIDNSLFRSYLTFAGSNIPNKDNSNDDGFLTAYEAMNLNLDSTELVTLSACETGLGEIKNGEGVNGLQRAFINAGAKKIVMSLWKVYDQPTREFMVQFYEYYLSGMSLRKAFRKAQIFMKEKYPNPFIWGSFVMVEG